MRTLADLMDQASPPRLKLMLLIAFHLMSTNSIYLDGNSTTTGVDQGLHCVSDYLFTINCSLSIAPSETAPDNGSYWLILTAEDEKYVCMLSNTNGYSFCSFNTNAERDPDAGTFMDIDFFDISECHNTSDGTQSCELLDETYMPVKNIKPNVPCCLMVIQNSNKCHFNWKSSYEEYLPSFDLIDNLMYELHYYKKGHKENAKPVHTDKTNISVGDFLPDTEYAVRVRSSPNQVSYTGHWSEWSPEVHWKTEPVVNDPSTNTHVPRLAKRVFIPLCVMAPLLLLLCFAPFKKWRQSAFIPTPAPYFQSLYSDYQGDFKSWVVTSDNTADLLKAEVTLRIDTMTKCADDQGEDRPSPFHHQLIEEGPRDGVSDPASDASLLGIPYAVSPGPGLKSLSLGSEPGNTVEGDSGCWLCSDTSLEKDAPWYSNEYCTLSTFQKSGSVMAEHHGSGSSFSKVNSKDYQNGCLQGSII